MRALMVLTLVATMAVATHSLFGNAQQASGRHIYQQTCAPCHDAHSVPGENGPSLQGLFKKTFLPSGLPANERFVRQTILNGRNMMPAAASALTPQQLDDLVAYLHTI